MASASLAQFRSQVLGEPAFNCMRCRWIVTRARSLTKFDNGYGCVRVGKKFGAFRWLPHSATRESHEGGRMVPSWCPLRDDPGTKREGGG